MSTKLERVLYIAAHISEGKYPSVEDFMHRFEVKRRTILRDIEFLQNRFHAPIAYSRAHRGYYLTDPQWNISTIPVTEGQLLALLLSIELIEQNLGTPFEQPLRAAIDHVADMLTDEVQLSVQKLLHHYSVRRGAAARSSMDLLLAILQVIQQRHPMEILYFTASRGQETRRVIHPYHLFNLQGEWQLIAYDLYRQSIRQFALQRVREWRILSEETFDQDPSFSPDTYFANSFQAEHSDEVMHITLQFDPYQAHYMRERTWHPSQTNEDLPDGSLIMHFTTGSVTAVKRWILSYGQHVRVLAPASFAHAIKEEIHATLAQYENTQ